MLANGLNFVHLYNVYYSGINSTYNKDITDLKKNHLCHLVPSSRVRPLATTMAAPLHPLYPWHLVSCC